jgi:hypothetical protein
LKIWKIAALVAGFACLCACAPTGRFEWGGYEGALFAYTKHPEARENYRQALKRAVEAGKADHRLAPGLLAELGFLSLEDGDSAAAESYFTAEMAAFPESSQFLKGVIARRATKSGAATTSAMPSAPNTAVDATASQSQGCSSLFTFPCMRG